jgi:pimeloyl-ACP methyl ester carboxylesterase
VENCGQAQKRRPHLDRGPGREHPDDRGNVENKPSRRGREHRIHPAQRRKPDGRPERYNPDAWTDEYAMLTRPGAREIQASLLYDYPTNVEAYPAWQAWLRAHRPPTLVLWGRYDPSFIVPGAEAYLRDVPDAELHLLEAGHFALGEALDEAAALILGFLARIGV